MITDRIEEIKAAVNEQLKKSSALQDVQDIRVNVSYEELERFVGRRTSESRPGCQFGTGSN